MSVPQGHISLQEAAQVKHLLKQRQYLETQLWKRVTKDFLNLERHRVLVVFSMTVRFVSTICGSGHAFHFFAQASITPGM